MTRNISLTQKVTRRVKTMTQKVTRTPKARKKSDTNSKNMFFEVTPHRKAVIIE